LRRFLPGVLALAVAVALFGPLAGSTLAACSASPCVPGSTVTLDGGLDNQPPTCSSGVREAHFIINGLSTAQATALIGTTVTATFSNGTNSSGFIAQAPPVDQALITVPMNSNTATVTGASFIVPNVAGVIDTAHPLVYNNFNLSGGDCNGTTGTTTSTTNTTHSTPAVPELDSVVLFGAGALSLVAFAFYQRRRQQGEA